MLKPREKNHPTKVLHVGMWGACGHGLSWESYFGVWMQWSYFRQEQEEAKKPLHQGMGPQVNGKAPWEGSCLLSGQRRRRKGCHQRRRGVKRFELIWTCTSGFVKTNFQQSSAKHMSAGLVTAKSQPLTHDCCGAAFAYIQREENRFY